jgi:hypothetical protein
MSTLEQIHFSAVELRNRNPKPHAWFTRLGLPISVELNWPFHLSTSGADFFVLHGDMKLEAEVKDGTPLHALLSVHLSQTVKEALPSLDREVCESLIINSLRKEVDVKQLEFLKTSKRQPVPVSSRFFNSKTGRFANDPFPEDQIPDFLMKKVFWLRHKPGGSAAPVWIADPYDAEYLVTTTDKLVKASQNLAQRGLLRLDGEFAMASEALVAKATQLTEEMKQAYRSLEAKHEFERG